MVYLKAASKKLKMFSGLDFGWVWGIRIHLNKADLEFKSAYGLFNNLSSKSLNQSLDVSLPLGNSSKRKVLVSR